GLRAGTTPSCSHEQHGVVGFATAAKRFEPFVIERRIGRLIRGTIPDPRIPGPRIDRGDHDRSRTIQSMTTNEGVSDDRTGLSEIVSSASLVLVGSLLDSASKLVERVIIARLISPFSRYTVKLYVLLPLILFPPALLLSRVISSNIVTTPIFAVIVGGRYRSCLPLSLGVCKPKTRSPSNSSKSAS